MTCEDFWVWFCSPRDPNEETVSETLAALRHTDGCEGCLRRVKELDLFESEDAEEEADKWAEQRGEKILAQARIDPELT